MIPDIILAELVRGFGLGLVLFLVYRWKGISPFRGLQGLVAALIGIVIVDVLVVMTFNQFKIDNVPFSAAPFYVGFFALAVWGATFFITYSVLRRIFPRKQNPSS